MRSRPSGRDVRLERVEADDRGVDRDPPRWRAARSVSCSTSRASNERHSGRPVATASAIDCCAVGEPLAVGRGHPSRVEHDLEALGRSPRRRSSRPGHEPPRGAAPRHEPSLCGHAGRRRGQAGNDHRGCSFGLWDRSWDGASRRSRWSLVLPGRERRGGGRRGRASKPETPRASYFLAPHPGNPCIPARSSRVPWRSRDT